MRSLHKDIITQSIISEESLTQEGHFYTADGLSTLQLAAREGRANVVMHLLAANLDNNIDEFEEKPMEHHHPDAVKTPFYLAVEYGHTFLAIKLLAYGASRDLALRIATRLSQDHLIESIEDVPFQKHLTALRVIQLGEIIESKTIPEIEVALVANRLKIILKDTDAISGIIERLMFCSSHKLASLLLKDHKPRCEESIYTAGYWAAIIKSSLLIETCNTSDDWLLTLRQLNSDRERQALKYALEQAPAPCKKQFAQVMRTEIKAPQDEKLSDEQIHFYQCASRGQLDDNLFILEYKDYLMIVRYALKKYNYVAVQEILNKTYSNLRNDFLNYVLEQKALVLAQILFSEFNFSYTLSVPGEVLGIDHFPIFLQAFSSNEGYAHQLINAGIKQDELPSKELVACARTLLPNPSLYVATILRCITNRYQIPNLQLESDPLKKDSLKINPLKPHKVYHVMTKTELSEHDFSLISTILVRFGVVLRGKKPTVLEAKEVSHFNSIPEDIWREIIPYLSGQTLAAIPAVSQRFRQYKLQTLRQNRFDQERLLKILIDSIEKDMQSRYFLLNKYKMVPLSALVPISLLAIGIVSLVIMLARDKTISADLADTMTSYGKTCMDLRLYKNHEGTCGSADITPYTSISKIPECEALCKEYHNNTLFLFGIIWGLAFGILALALPYEVYKDARRRGDGTLLRQASPDVHQNLQELQQAYPQLLHHTLPTSLRIDLLREAQALQPTTNLASQNEVDDAVVINIKDAETKPAQNKRDKKIQDGRRTFGKAYVSPARLMDNIFSMFKSEPEVSFDQANSRLLCSDNSDSESDKDSSDETLELIRHKR